MLSYLKSFLWSNEESDDNEKDENGLLSDLGVDFLERFEIVGQGIVTELNEDYGLVDGKFYFSRDLIPKISENPSIRIGDTLNYRAFRMSENQEWKIEQIDNAYSNDKWSSTNQNNDFAETANTKDVGKVVKVQDHLVHIEIQGEFHKEIFTCDKSVVDYTSPYPGDLVSIELALAGTTFDDLTGAKILKASPLRTMSASEGSITSWWQNMKRGIINGYIFFNTEPCSQSYVPRVHDQVRVHAIGKIFELGFLRIEGQ